MSLLSIFRKNEKNPKIESYDDFWQWFEGRKRPFRDVIMSGGNIVAEVFDQTTPKLDELGRELFLLAGKFDDDTAELIFTPDGKIEEIVFAEELVAAAPQIAGWRFTALKPESEGFYMTMNGHSFSEDNLTFLPNETWERPDEVDITVVHEELNDENRRAIVHGCFIFLDNYLGELRFATEIDNLTFEGPSDSEGPRKPINQLKAYLTERSLRFVEKNDGTRKDTENDEYASFEGQTADGFPVVGVMNNSLIYWDRKASHPWIAAVEVEFDGTENNGLPDESTYDLLGEIEDQVEAVLKDVDGYLNVGRETGANERTFYLACKEFRKPSKVLDSVRKTFADRAAITYSIYKDKYWRTFDPFVTVHDDAEPS